MDLAEMMSPSPSTSHNYNFQLNQIWNVVEKTCLTKIKLRLKQTNKNIRIRTNKKTKQVLLYTNNKRIVFLFLYKNDVLKDERLWRYKEERELKDETWNRATYDLLLLLFDWVKGCVIPVWPVVANNKRLFNFEMELSLSFSYTSHDLVTNTPIFFQ